MKKTNFKSLDESDMRPLASMVEIEVYAGLKDAEEGGHSKGTVPHVDDVFLAKPGQNIQYGEKLICRCVEGDLFFFDKNNKFVELGRGVSVLLRLRAPPEFWKTYFGPVTANGPGDEP